MKKIIAALLSLVIFTTIVPISHVNDHESAAAYAPSCSIISSKMKNTAQFLENLLESYERSMMYANDPFHADYRDRHIELALSALEMAFGRFDIMMNHLDQLMICEGDAESELENIEQALIQFLSLVDHPAVKDEFHELTSTFYNKFANVLNDLLAFRDHPVYDAIYQKFHSDSVQDFIFLADNTLGNIQEGLYDKFLFRIPSLSHENSSAHNMTIVADSVNSVINSIKNLLIDYNDSKAFSKRTASFTSSAIKELVGSVRDNVTAMTTRGLYITLFQGAIRPHMPANQLEFGDDIAGGLASMMTATDPISFGLAYSELIHIINDYNVKGLEQVQNQLDQSRIANQNARLLQTASDFASEMTAKLYDPNVTEDQFTAHLRKGTEKLSEEMLAIYELDPNEIKIYYNGNKLEPSVPPFVRNGTTMVPLRLITNQIGLDITWNGKEKSISFSTEVRWRKTDVVMTIGSKTVQVGRRTVSLLEPPVLVNGTTFVPLRFISEQIGLDVTWVPESKSVMIE